MQPRRVGSKTGPMPIQQQLAAYLKLEGETEGYYVVFDYRRNPEPRIETDTLDGTPFAAMSYLSCKKSLNS